MNILRKHGGQIDHSTMLRFLLIDTALLKRIAATLIVCDQIEMEELNNGKRGHIKKTAA